MEETNQDGQPFATGTRTAEANLKRNERAEDSRPPESEKKRRWKECRFGNVFLIVLVIVFF